jgi:hypothetical protein
MQQLDTGNPSCAAQANNPQGLGDDCWIDIADAHLTTAAGEHAVIRVIAATPQTMPALPLTGGVSAQLFLFSGLAAAVVATGANLGRQAKRRVALRRLKSRRQLG